MDIAALVTAIVLARMNIALKATANVNMGQSAVMGGGNFSNKTAVGFNIETGMIKSILFDRFKSPTISALVLGLALGFFAKPDSVCQNLYEPLFRGLLFILMLIMRMKGYARLSEMRMHMPILFMASLPLSYEYLRPHH